VVVGFLVRRFGEIALVVVTGRKGGGVVVEGWCWWFILRWLWWRRSCVAVVVFRFVSVYVGASLVGFWMGGHRSGVETLCGREFFQGG